MYGLGVLREGMVPDVDLHGERCSLLFIWMNACNIFFNNNLWFKIVEIKME
jgi:hypothetical protein